MRCQQDPDRVRSSNTTPGSHGHTLPQGSVQKKSRDTRRQADLQWAGVFVSILGGRKVGVGWARAAGKVAERK